MAKRKIKAVKLQHEIQSDEEWNKLTKLNGLIVIDVYSKWCGPCVAMKTTLRRVRHQLGSNNLHFATALSDTISVLKQFTNKSIPTWVFLVNGNIINVMYGANSPKLARLIGEELKKAKTPKDPPEITEIYDKTE